MVPMRFVPQNPKLRFLLSALAVAWLALTASLPAGAQSWPNRPVKVIVPFLAGSATDVTARLISEKLSGYLGVSFVVENKTGAGGNLATDAVAKADPDYLAEFDKARAQALAPPRQSAARQPSSARNRSPATTR